MGLFLALCSVPFRQQLLKHAIKHSLAGVQLKILWPPDEEM